MTLLMSSFFATLHIFFPQCKALEASNLTNSPKPAPKLSFFSLSAIDYSCAATQTGRWINRQGLLAFWLQDITGVFQLSTKPI